MSRIYVCNSYSDSISEIDESNMELLRKIKLSTLNERVGPHGICRYQDNLIIANKHKGSISIIDLHEYSRKDYYIGCNCSDVKTCEDKAYVVCGDTNDIKVFDLKEKRVEESIPCGNYPKSIYVDNENKRILVNNFMENSISAISIENHEENKKIVVGEYPGKVIYNSIVHMYAVSVSFIGKHKNGCIKLLDKDFNYVDEIGTGKCPVDFCIHGSKSYVSNFEDGTISVIDLMNRKKVEDIKVYGMPRGIAATSEYLYVADYYGNYLYKINLRTGDKIKTVTGNEPVAIMVL